MTLIVSHDIVTYHVYGFRFRLTRTYLDDVTHTDWEINKSLD